MEEEAGSEVVRGAGGDGVVGEEQGKGGRDDRGWFCQEEVGRMEGRVTGLDCRGEGSKGAVDRDPAG